MQNSIHKSHLFTKFIHRQLEEIKMAKNIMKCMDCGEEFNYKNRINSDVGWLCPYCNSENIEHIAGLKENEKRK